MSATIAAAQLQTLVQNASQQPADAGAATHKLGEKFAAMLQQPHMAKPESPGDGSTSIVSKVMGAQDAELQHTVNDVMQVTRDLPTMSVPEMNAAMMRTTLELAGTQLDMEAKMGVANSSKSAIETLMKNQ
jgi:type III secretion inner rod protein HrpB2